MELKKEAYKHGFSGSYSPKGGYPSYHTFSYGCFQWLPKSSGKGLKKSAVIYRVIGPIIYGDKVFERATEICLKLDTGWKPDKKSERIKT